MNAQDAIDIIRLTASAIGVVVEAYPAVAALIERLQSGGADVELSELEDVAFRIRGRSAELQAEVDEGRIVGPPKPA